MKTVPFGELPIRFVTDWLTRQAARGASFGEELSFKAL
jgi:hypothetical protein